MTTTPERSDADGRRSTDGFKFIIPYRRIIGGVTAAIMLVLSLAGMAVRSSAERIMTAAEKVPAIERDVDSVKEDIKDVKLRLDRVEDLQADVKYIRRILEKREK
jgi:hypothetical protein